MLKRAMVPDLKFCGCHLFLETHRDEVTETDIQETAKMFADVAVETERSRTRIKRHYTRRAKEVLGIV